MLGVKYSFEILLISFFKILKYSFEVNYINPYFLKENYLFYVILMMKSFAFIYLIIL